MSNETKKLKYQPTKTDSTRPLNPPTAGSAEIPTTYDLTNEQIMADPRVMALVEALQRAKHNVPGFYIAWHADVDATLAALTDNE